MATAVPTSNSPAAKESCNYSIDLSKQFLSLACAGVAFVVGLVFAGDLRLGVLTVSLSLAALGLSIVLGWLYLMNVVSYIRRYDNYDVYGPRHRTLAIGQIVAFFLALAVLGVVTYRSVARPAPVAAVVPGGVLKIGSLTIAGLGEGKRDASIVFDDRDGFTLTVPAPQERVTVPTTR